MDIYVHMVTGWEKGYQKLKPKCMVRFYRQSQVLDPSHLPWGHTHTFIKFSCLPSYKPHPDLTNATSHSTVCKHVLNYPRPYSCNITSPLHKQVLNCPRNYATPHSLVCRQQQAMQARTGVRSSRCSSLPHGTTLSVAICRCCCSCRCRAASCLVALVSPARRVLCGVI